MRLVKLKLKRPLGETLHAVSRPRAQRGKRYTYSDKTLTLPEWAQETGISKKTLFERIKQYDWPLERALTEPVLNCNRAVRPRELNRLRIARIAASFREEAAR